LNQRKKLDRMIGWRSCLKEWKNASEIVKDTFVQKFRARAEPENVIETSVPRSVGKRWRLDREKRRKL
jgi:hypothetical protein